MQFTELKLNNVGQFQGITTFNLATQKINKRPKPIILVGGKNGTGKTTFLQSILLCLYGSFFLGPKTSRAKYEQYLTDLIHRPKGKRETPSHAYIELEFYHTHSGKSSLYKIHRVWGKEKEKNQRIG